VRITQFVKAGLDVIAKLEEIKKIAQASSPL
jgi:hypothetical protein